MKVEVIKKVLSEITEKSSDAINARDRVTKNVNFFVKGNGKGVTLEAGCDYKFIEDDTILVVGDSSNDYTYVDISEIMFFVVFSEEDARKNFYEELLDRFGRGGR